MIRIIRNVLLLFEKKERRKLGFLFFFMLFGAFWEMLGVSLMIPMVSALLDENIIRDNAMVQAICSLFAIHSHTSFALVCIGGLMLVYGLKNFFLFLQYRYQFHFIYQNRFRVQKRLLHFYLTRPYEYYLQADTGEILRVVQEDVTTAFNLVRTIITFGTEFVVSVTLFVTVFVISPGMTLMVSMVLLVLLLAVVKGVRPILQREGRKHQKCTAKANQSLLQTIYGIKEIKIGRKEAFFEGLYETQAAQVIEAGRKDSLLENTPRLLIEAVSLYSMLGGIAVLLLMGEDMHSLVPVISAFAMAGVKLLPSANRMVAAVNSMTFLSPALDSVLEHLQGIPDTSQGQGGTVESSSLEIHMILQLKDISYHYPDSEVNVLTNANMTIPVGSMVGIVGASGAGKTTAINILLGLLKPQSGQVLVDGRDISSCYESWVSTIGYIPQQVFLLDASIMENVAFGKERKDISEEAVWKALDEAQMGEYVRRLPHGLHTRIGENGIRLSGGQRQRIGIARALYTNPNLLVFDEATSALDTETEQAIMESIHALHGKKTMVMIAHRLSTIEQCDYIYRVAEGQIILEKEGENGGTAKEA